MDKAIPNHYGACKSTYLKGNEIQEWARELGYGYRPRLETIKRDLADSVEETSVMLKSFGAEILGVKYSVLRKTGGRFIYTGLYVMKVRKPIGH